MSAHGSKSEYRKPVDVLSTPESFVDWVINKCTEFHVKNIKQHGEFLENYTSTSNYFTGSCKLRLGTYQKRQGILQCKSLFYAGNRGFPEVAFKYSLEYLNTSLALPVGLSLAPLYTVELFSSFVRAHSKALGTEKRTNKDQRGKEQEFAIWTQSTRHYTKCPYYRCRFFLLSLSKEVSLLTIGGCLQNFIMHNKIGRKFFQGEE